MRLQIDIRITPDFTNPNNYNDGMGNLQLTETHIVTGTSFMEIASVLGKFHDLMEEIKEKQNT